MNLSLENSTVYLLGVPIQADSGLPDVQKPSTPSRIKGLHDWWRGRNLKTLRAWLQHFLRPIRPSCRGTPSGTPNRSADIGGIPETNHRQFDLRNTIISDAPRAHHELAWTVWCKSTAAATSPTRRVAWSNRLLPIEANQRRLRNPATTSTSRVDRPSPLMFYRKVSSGRTAGKANSRPTTARAYR